MLNHLRKHDITKESERKKQLDLGHILDFQGVVGPINVFARRQVQVKSYFCRLENHVGGGGDRSNLLGFDLMSNSDNFLFYFIHK